jgi:hypothetical protein
MPKTEPITEWKVDIMSNRDALKTVEDQLSSLDQQMASLRDQEFELIVARHKIIQKLLNEEKPLRGTAWTLELNHEGRVYLEYTGSRQDDQLEELNKWCSKSWHDDFKVDDDVIIYFDDNVLTLGFKDPNKIIEIARRFELVILGSNISERVALLKQELNGLENICQQFALKL